MKNGLALRIIDDKSFTRSFTKSELADLTKNLEWVQCDGCGKWRVLLEKEDLGEQWYCSENNDSENNNCDSSEKTQAWYENRIQRMACATDSSPVKCKARDEIDSAMSIDEKQSLVDNDPVLQYLLAVRTSKSDIVSRFYFHDALLASRKDTDQELESARKAVQPADRSLDVAEAVMDLETTAFRAESSELLTTAKPKATPMAMSQSATGRHSEENIDPALTDSASTEMVADANKTRRVHRPAPYNIVGTKGKGKGPIKSSTEPTCGTTSQKRIPSDDTSSPALARGGALVDEKRGSLTLETAQARKKSSSSTRGNPMPESGTLKAPIDSAKGSTATKRTLEITLLDSDDSSSDEDSLSRKPTFSLPPSNGRSPLKRASTKPILETSPRKRRARAEQARSIPADSEIIDIVDSDDE